MFTPGFGSITLDDDFLTFIHLESIWVLHNRMFPVMSISISVCPVNGIGKSTGVLAMMEVIFALGAELVYVSSDLHR